MWADKCAISQRIKVNDFFRKFETLQKIPYRSFLEMPKKLEGVPTFYSIYFNLKPLNIQKFVKLFVSSPYKYRREGINGVQRVLEDFKKLEDFYRSYWSQLGDSEKIPFGFILLHSIFATWRLNGIYEFIIDCPPTGFNIESSVLQNKLPMLEHIKKDCTDTYEGVDQRIYAFLENVMKEMRRIILGNRRIVKEKYRKEIEEALQFKNFYEMMQGSVLQLLYHNPGINRFQQPIPKVFRKQIKQYCAKPTKYFMFPINKKHFYHGLQGRGASPGKIVGKVKVCLSVAEAKEEIKNKEILVCHKTDPSWTPLFTKISGVITESGGVLSHAAIVAREYKIPCIVGVEHLLEKLKDNVRIEMDGGTGKIRLL